MIQGYCLVFVLPFSDLCRHSKKGLFTFADCKAPSPDLRVFIRVMHEYPEPNKVVLRDPVVCYVWVKQDGETKLGICTVDLEWDELSRLVNICPEM